MLKGLSLSILLTLISIETTFAIGVPVERRKDPFDYRPGYYLLPLPYSIPGYGDGFALGGMALNMMESDADLLGFVITGDITGAGATLTNTHLLPKRLLFDITAERLGRVSIQSYSQRGFAGDPNDYSLIGIKDVDFIGTRLTATWWQRRLELFAAGYWQQGRLDDIRTSNGDLIQQTDAEFGPNKILRLGGRLDFTDDYDDPRSGYRLEADLTDQLQKDDGHIDSYQLNLSLSYFWPLGQRSTWLVNYFHSDAIVRREGETDRSIVMQQLGVNCDQILSANDRQQCDDYVENSITANRYGSATALGGLSRLRAFPENRFVGAHTRFIGTEIRWNLTEEFTPFDLYIMQDVRTLVQVAFFYEYATLADHYEELWDKTRSSLGVGLRMITASGLVFRADIANGEEGSELSVMIGYPWENF